MKAFRVLSFRPYIYRTYLILGYRITGMAFLMPLGIDWDRWYNTAYRCIEPRVLVSELLLSIWKYDVGIVDTYFIFWQKASD